MEASAGSRLRHPQARRSLRLHGVEVAFALVRTRRKSIGLRIAAQGLEVRAPNWVSLRQIDEVVQAKAAWVLGKLVLPPVQDTRARVVWGDGVQLPYLGAVLRVVLVSPVPSQRAGRAAAVRHAVLHAEPSGWLLHLPLGHAAGAADLRAAMVAWWTQQAHTTLEQRLSHFAPLLGVRPAGLAIGWAAGRWGSAKSDGQIRLNARLLHLPQALADYVVVHELAHLREMNHSPRFWAAVGAVLPDFKQRRLALRTSQTPFW